MSADTEATQLAISYVMARTAKTLADPEVRAIIREALDQPKTLIAGLANLVVGLGTEVGVEKKIPFAQALQDYAEFVAWEEGND